MPELLGKHDVAVSHYDANLRYNVIVGRSAIGVLHFVSKNPIEWCSNKQAAAETVTRGTEHSSDRACAEQIIELLIALRHLEMLLREKSHMLGNSMSVVNSSTAPHAKIHKRHVTL